MRTEQLQKRKYKREQKRRMQQLIERCLLTVCLILLLTIAGSSMLSKATGAEEKTYYKYYKQIEIQEGDTLWSIAGAYMDHGPYHDRKEYMEEVISINGLISTKIKTGQHLIVPYYEDSYH